MAEATPLPIRQQNLLDAVDALLALNRLEWAILDGRTARALMLRNEPVTPVAYRRAFLEALRELSLETPPIQDTHYPRRSPKHRQDD